MYMYICMYIYIYIYIYICMAYDGKLHFERGRNASLTSDIVASIAGL